MHGRACASARSASAPADRAPVVLRHSRIYILPTRRGYAVIATLITMLLTSLNYALSLGLGVTFLLGGLVAAALLHTFRNLAGIEIKPLAASDTFAGGHVVFSLAVSSGAIDRRAITISANDANAKAAIAAGSTQTVTLAAPAHDARPRSARARHAVVVASARPVARLGVRPFPADRASCIRRRRRIRRRCRPARRASIRARRAAATTPTSPACANTSAAIRCSASHGKPSRAAPAGSRSRSKAPAAAVRSRSTGRDCLRNSTPRRGCRGCRAWVLAAERTHAPVRAGAARHERCPPAPGREHRRAALTALALVPADTR